jgi:hypothetical protein
MNSKLTQSLSTLYSGYEQKVTYRDEQTTLKNPFGQTLPMKFPKNRIRKETSQSILCETM